MRLSRAIVGTVLFIGIAGASFAVWRGYHARPVQPFPRYTTDADGAIEKQLPALSSDSLARLPDPKLKYYIFGRDVSVTDGGIFRDPVATQRPEERWVAFTVANAPNDIAHEYREYFTAVGWKFLSSVAGTSSFSYMVRSGSAQITVSIYSERSGGSLIQLRHLYIR